jgi:hypothetical protein
MINWDGLHVGVGKTGERRAAVKMFQAKAQDVSTSREECWWQTSSGERGGRCHGRSIIKHRCSSVGA